jgi:hypothetical protein
MAYTSSTEKRHQHHVSHESSIMLFAHLSSDDRALWFRGPATDRRHRPAKLMAITWQLENELPGDLFARFAAAVAEFRAA